MATSYNYNRRVNSRSDRYRTEIFVDGNTARAAVAVPKERVRREPKGRTISTQAVRNRQKASQVSRTYVLFLALVSVATLFVCVRYVQLRSTVTAQLKTVASMESQLNQLTSENNALYNQTVNDIDLEQVRDVAINQLGMSYADEDQIIWYNKNAGSYVRQYQSVSE